jgi:hypothetical protein
MFLKSLKQPLPTVLTAIVVIAVAIWIKSLISPTVSHFYFDEYEMPLYQLVTKLSAGNILIEKIIAFAIMLIAAFALVQLNTKHILIKYRTYLPALFFILLSSSFLPLQRINPAIFASVLLIFAIDSLFNAYVNPRPINNFFMASFIVSVASLFYFPAIFYFILVIISLVVLNLFRLREWLSTIFGLLAPWFFAFFYYYYFQNNIQALPTAIFNSLVVVETSKLYGTLFITLYSFIGFLFIISLMYLLRNMSSQKISIRKYYQIFLWFAGITAVITFVYPFASIEIVYLASVPGSFLLANYFTFAKNRFWSEALFICLAFIVLLIQFYN